MGSEQRQRTHILTVRLYDEEYAYLRALVAAQRPTKVTRADVARAILFDVPLIDRPSCSDKHGTHCTAHHHGLVTGYRVERHRQEVEHESTLSSPGEAQLWRENGGKLITFTDWLNHHTAEEHP